MLEAELLLIIEQASLTHGVNAELIQAIVIVESGGNPHAWRHEKDWKYLWFPREWATKRAHRDFDFECYSQSISYGLMQIMGSVAMELNFNFDLPMLFEPDVNINFGAKKLATLMRKYDVETDVIAAYNAGSARKTKGLMYVNQPYVDKVSAVLTELRKLK